MNRKKRIIVTFASVPFIRGGAEICVESLCIELKKRGYLVEMISIPFQWSPKIEIIKNIMAWRMLNLEKIAGNSIDLLIATKFPSYAVKHPNKVMWLFHQHRAVYDLFGTPYSDFDRHNPDDQTIRDQIIRVDNKTLAESKGIYTIARNTSERLKHYNRIKSTPLYHPPKLQGKYHCQNFGDYILSVGRLEGLKRIDLLLRSLTYTDKRIRCIIAGTGGMEPYLKQLTKELKLDGRVEFAGYVDDEKLIELYANCFAVYFAPFDEDYGYITLEAFLSKKPVVTCSDSGGVLEFAEHDVNGKIAKQADPGLLGACITELYIDKSYCEYLGKNGFSKIKDINWDDVIKHLTATI
ncbi:MAG: glycosyltransferase family 4 protein [Desulfosporosinus sp.]|nr:glycosyltransferase family 4 protein [Desulfosporosinus sp.]